MAANKIATIKTNFVFLVTIILLPFLGMGSHSEGVPLKMKEKKMTLYAHDYFGGGPNASDVIVAGIPGKEWGYSKFGTVFVSDALLTKGIKPDSKRIGRAQGISTTVSLDGNKLHALFSILFTHGKYNGSTLQLQGVNSQQLNAVSEVSIVSGTGFFRFATGYATLQTIMFDLTISYDVSVFNITAHHY